MEENASPRDITDVHESSQIDDESISVDCARVGIKERTLDGLQSDMEEFQNVPSHHSSRGDVTKDPVSFSSPRPEGLPDDVQVRIECIGSPKSFSPDFSTPMVSPKSMLNDGDELLDAGRSSSYHSEQTKEFLHYRSDPFASMPADSHGALHFNTKDHNMQPEWPEIVYHSAEAAPSSGVTDTEVMMTRSTSSRISKSFGSQHTTTNEHDSSDRHDDFHDTSCADDDDDDSRDSIDIEVETSTIRAVTQHAPSLVAVRSESGTDLHVKPAASVASYPPMQLLSAPRNCWTACPRSTGGHSAQEKNVTPNSAKGSLPASIGESERHFEAKILGFVSQAEKDYEHGASVDCRHKFVPRLRYSEDSAGRRSGGSALHAARGLRDAGSGTCQEHTASSHARSASARRSRGQQQAAKILVRYGEVANLCEAERTTCRKRSHSQNSRMPKPEDGQAQRPDAPTNDGHAEKRFQQRRLTVEEILEIASSTRTVGSARNCAPRAKIGAAIAMDDQMKPSSKKVRPSSAKTRRQIF
jgi:hypothetical protein